MATIRRLTAVLAADVAGYSRLMGADEEGTLRRLQRHRRELIDRKVREHRGRIVKTTGDGTLVEFPSVVDAVQCAVEVQRGMVERNADVAKEQRIEFRIGINLGDVIIEGDDIYGDGVNLAARLEALATPGGICVSRGVRDQVRDRLDIAFDDLGEHQVKNIARPLRVFAINLKQRPAGSSAGAEQAASASTSMAPPGLPRLSIVVLPFANLSNDLDQDYFTDGITDDLTTDLSGITDSFVIARTTAFTYKGKSVDVKQIGRDLGVRYVLEGSVRRLGEQVRVNVQLIDAEDGAHIWAERFDTDRTNLAKAQDEIVGRLARTLQLELVDAAARRIEREKPVNPDARDFVMRGWAGWYRPETEAQLQEDQRLFERALELAPQSAEARIGIASVLIEMVTVTWSKSRAQDLARAEQLLSEALELERNNSKLHWALGLLRRLQNRLVESKIEFEKAIALDHNNAGSMLQLGFTLNTLGQPDAALPYFEKAIKLNPQAQNIHFYYLGLGSCYFFQNKLDKAIEFLKKANASNPQYYIVPLYLAGALGFKGDVDEAKAALAEALRLKPQIRSLAVLPQYNVGLTNPSYAVLAAKTLYVGLRRAGLPDE